MSTTVPLPSLVMIQAKSPTRRPGAAGGGAVAIVGSPGGASTCTKATSVGTCPGASVMPGELANTERRGVPGAPTGKQPSERGGGKFVVHGVLMSGRVGVCCK